MEEIQRACHEIEQKYQETLESFEQEKKNSQNLIEMLQEKKRERLGIDHTMEHK